MVPDLEKVDVRNHPTRQQLRLHRRLCVAGEQRAEAAAAQQEHDRGVVDVTLEQRCRRVRRAGVEHLDACHRAKAEAGTGTRQRICAAALRPGQGDEPCVARILVGTARIQHAPNAEALEHRHQAGDVVLVRVSEHHHGDAPLPEGKLLAKAAQHQVWIRAAVHQHRLAVRGHDQDRVALAHVQHDDAGRPAREVRERDRRDRHDQQGTAEREPSGARARLPGTRHRPLPR